ncbi:MAG: hypothetical protein HY978_04180 [Candidatus Liptonbacteria bacterium]|nr:hypothetical protein [Candidatus Liptonbacteria bacterium]
MRERIPSTPISQEQLPEYLEMLAAEIPKDEYPPAPEEAEKLQKWGITPPLNNRVAQEMIRYVESAMGMKGEHQGLDRKRIAGVIEMQDKWPRGVVIWAKPMMLKLFNHPEFGSVHKQARSDKFVPVKIVDVRAKPFEEKIRTRERMSKVGIQREKPLADYSLRVLVKAGKKKFEVHTLSFAYIKRPDSRENPEIQS